MLKFPFLPLCSCSISCGPLLLPDPQEVEVSTPQGPSTAALSSLLLWLLCPNSSFCAASSMGWG